MAPGILLGWTGRGIRWTGYPRKFMLEQPSHGQRLPCQGTAVRDGPEEAPGVHVPCCSATPLLINGCSHPAGPLPVTTVAPRPGVGGAIVRWRGYQDPRRPPRLSVTR